MIKFHIQGVLNLNKEEDDFPNNVRLPRDDELIGKVVNMLGNNRARVRCEDGVTRVCRIPGRMRKRIWVREGDTVILEPWDFQEEKADIVWRYISSQADALRIEGLL